MKTNLAETYRVEHSTKESKKPRIPLTGWSGEEFPSLDEVEGHVNSFLERKTDLVLEKTRRGVTYLGYELIPEWGAGERITLPHSLDDGRNRGVDAWKALEQGLVPRSYIYFKIIPQIGTRSLKGKPRGEGAE